VTPDGRFLYVSHGTPQDTARSDIVGFAIQPGGGLGPVVARAEAGISGAETLVTPNGRFVYVVHQRSDDVVGFRIGANGSLTEVTRVVGAVWLEEAAMSPDGRLLYAGSIGFRPPDPDFPPDPDRPSALLGFRINDDGSVTQVARVPMPDPAGIAFAPDGRHVYASSYTRHSVTAFAVERSGGLTALQTLDTRGDRPAFHSTSVLPNRGPVAAFSASPRPAGQPTRFDATASSDRDGEVRRYDWDFGDGTTLADGGPTPRHTYRAPGTYRVRLTVTDGEGCSTRLVYTGQNALCFGSGAATVVHTVTISR
jgi:PKD domain/Lactonase, 7-bladed beta-propeller